MADNSTQYDNGMRGALFANDKRGNDKAPDYTGNCEIVGQKYRLAGWIQTSKGGQTYLSLKVSIPEPQSDVTPQEPLPF